MKIIITGGAGFIGSAAIRHLLNHSQHEVVNVDSLTYAGDLNSVADVSMSSRYRFENVDVTDGSALLRVFQRHEPDAVLHLAAESHVDLSIKHPEVFVRSNILGTFTLLQQTVAYWQKLPIGRRESFRFLHVSTDEVYGDLGKGENYFTEQTRYDPSSPYSASKAAADHLVRAWNRTYGLPCLVTHCTNNYGPYQLPEKLIPLMVSNALRGAPLPIYGDGLQVRDWLFVEDHVRALKLVLEKGEPGQSYNIGGLNEIANIELVRQICSILEELKPAKPSGCLAYQDLITHVTDRPGHDRRYAVDASRIRTELGWAPLESLATGLRKTVSWYLDNIEWSNRTRKNQQSFYENTQGP